MKAIELEQAGAGLKIVEKPKPAPYADGVVIWGGWDLDKNKPAQWNDNAEWWIETKQFINQLNNN